MKNPLLSFWVACILFGLLPGCVGQSASQDTAIQTPSRRDLFRSFREENRMLLVYGSQNAQHRAAYEALAADMSQQIEQFDLIAKSDQEVSATELSSTPLLLIGTPLSNSVILDLAPDLPIAFDEVCLKFEGKDFTDTSSVFCLSFYPNPLNPSLPLSMVTGLEDAALLNLYREQWANMSWGGWHFELYQQNQRRLMGKFADQTGAAWQVDKATLFDFDRAPVLKAQSEHYRFWSQGDEIDEGEILGFQVQCEDRLKALADFLGKDLSSVAPLDYYLYPSAEVKGLMVNQTQQQHADFESNKAHAVLHPQFESSDPGRELSWWIRQSLGKATQPAIETGLSLYFTENWEEAGYRYWAQHIYQAGLLPDISEVLNEEAFNRKSPLFMEPAAASLVEFLIDYWGKETFLDKYAHWEPQAQELGQLESLWQDWLSQQKPIGRTYYNRKLIPFDAIPRYMLKGFNLTHEGYQIYNGYISDRARQSMAYTESLGSNAVSIVPYTGMGDPHKPIWLRFARSAGGENDESVGHMLYQARKLNMTTLLKPQVWLWQGSWPGAVEMESEADWQQFFAFYSEWINHYALLAEIHGVDIFCAGVEFQQATLQRGEDWRKIFRQIRKLYKGKLTYAANWGAEFEGVDFWDELDFIGLNCYYPLAKGEDPSQEELDRNCKKVMAKVEKVIKEFDKPLLFTEIGFRSVEGTWTHPHEEIKGREFNETHQAMAYQAVFNSLEGKDWCKGLFWWNWGTDLQAYREADRSFSPYHKSAEATIRDWYR